MQIVGYVLDCRSYSFVCTLHYVISTIVQTYLKTLNCHKVIDISNYFGLTQLQNSPTRFNAILDLFDCNKPSLVKSIKNIPGLSHDHDCLAVDMDIQVQISKKPPRKIYKSGQANWDEIRNDTCTVRDAYMNDAPCRSVDENYSSMEKKHLKSMLGKHMPCKMVYFLIGHYTYRMFPPAIDIIPTSLAVVYSNGTYTN